MVNTVDKSLREHLFNTAIVAAQYAGRFIKRNANRALKLDFKGRVNIVTEIDRKSEELIVGIIQQEFPDHKIVAEEFTNISSESEFKWIIDPLDGTTNFVHSFPCYAVSIAVEYRDVIIIGAVYDPERSELFSAIKGEGAYLNRRKIKVSDVSRLKNSLLATGFPYELNENFYRNMDIFKDFYEKSQGIRRAGSAAIDLCYIACGRFDGYWEFDLNPWDVSAGALIVKEAGGEVTDFSGGKFSAYNKQILASNGRIHQEMIDIMKKFI